jgi:hypothetical protein
LYKDVMEATLARMNVEMTKMKEGREENELKINKLRSKLRIAAKNASQRQKSIENQKEKNNIAELLSKALHDLKGERQRVKVFKNTIKNHEENNSRAVEAVEMLVAETEKMKSEMKKIQNKNILLTNTIQEMSKNKNFKEDEVAVENAREMLEKQHINSPKYSRSKVEELQRSVAMLEAKNLMLERSLNSNSNSNESITFSGGTANENSKNKNGQKLVKDQVDRALQKLAASRSIVDNTNNLEENDDDDANDSEMERASAALEEDSGGSNSGSNSGSSGSGSGSHSSGSASQWVAEMPNAMLGLAFENN